jgi:hypothetical protein
MNCDDSDAWLEEYQADAYSLLSLAKSLAVVSNEYREGLPPNSAVLGPKNVRLLPLRRFKELQHKFGLDIIGAKNKLPDMTVLMQSGSKKRREAKEGCGRCVSFLLLAGVPSAMPFKVRAIASEGQPSILDLWAELHNECINVYQHLCYNQAFCRLEQTISSVEIYWQDQLHRVYFPQPSIIDLALEPATKQNMLAELDLSTPEDRAKG